MRSVLFTAIFSLLFASGGNSQDLNALRIFADQQLAAGNYPSALKEYQRLLFFDSENRFQAVYSILAGLFYQTSDYENASKYFDFALRTEQNDSLRFELILSKAMCNFRTGNFMAALNELLDLPETDNRVLTQKKYIFLGTTYFGLDDFKNAEENFLLATDSSQKEIVKSIFSDFAKYRHKFRPAKVELMSMLLPGLGQIYTGNTGNGLNSLGLLSAITFYSYKMFVNYGVIDGLLVLSSWFYRYYTGGYTNAHNFATHKIEHEKSEVYTKLINNAETNSFLKE